MFEKPWVVFAKRPFGGAKQVLAYLGRYTHRTAISNDRILKVGEQNVTFTWKDYRQNSKKQISTISGKEFLRRFCLHICPSGFTRIRHYGFLSSAAKTKALAKIRVSLAVKAPKALNKEEWVAKAMERMGIQPQVCKCCSGQMVLTQLGKNASKTLDSQ